MIRNENGFKHIISLGYNCEVSFRIKSYTQKEIDSYPLSWAYVLDQDNMEYILNAVLNGTALEGNYVVNEANMFRFEQVGCSFHSKMTKSAQFHNEDGSTNYEVANEQLIEMKSRFKYLGEKFQKILSEGALFVAKISSGNIEKKISDIAVWLEKNMKTDQYLFLAVVQETDWTKRIGQCVSEHVAVDTVSRFAPDHNTEHGGDLTGWISLLAYYDHIFDQNIPSKENRRNMVVTEEDLVDHDYISLKKWCDELTEARDWLLLQCEKKDAQIHELEEKIQKIEDVIDQNSKIGGKQNIVERILHRGNRNR